MKTVHRLAMVVLGAALVSGPLAAEPVKLIFDTDMGNDVDDALALAMIHALQNRGECELLAVTITKDHAETVPFVDAINTFYGRGDVPIGVVRGGATPGKSRFTGIAQEMALGRMVYPHDERLGAPHRDALEVLRSVLAGQPDQSVVITQVGFSTNLARLLDTRADEHSLLPGPELVARKVRLLSIMAGAFTPISGRTHLEYNVINDIPAATAIADRWPTPIVWSGFEVGLAIRYPAISIDQDFRYRARHPIAESYQAYEPTPHERPTWDLTSVLHAARPDRGYFELSPAGKVTVHEKGETTFDQTSSGQQRYLVVQEEEVARIRELMATLVSEPPTRGLER